MVLICVPTNLLSSIAPLGAVCCYRDPTAVGVDDVLDDRQAQPHPERRPEIDGSGGGVQQPGRAAKGIKPDGKRSAPGTPGSGPNGG